MRIVSNKGLHERELLFRYIHETLATNQRLHMLKIKANDEYDNCGQIAYSLHIIYLCK